MPLKLASVVVTLVSSCTLLARKRNSSNGNLCLAVVIQMVILPAGCAESAWHTTTARLVLVGGVRKLHLLLSHLLILPFSDDTISVHSAELFNINQSVAAVQKGRGITATRALSHNRRLTICTSRSYTCSSHWSTCPWGSFHARWLDAYGKWYVS